MPHDAECLAAHIAQSTQGLIEQGLTDGGDSYEEVVEHAEGLLQQMVDVKR